MLTNFLQIKSVICIPAKTYYEYAFSVLNQITFLKIAVSWVLGISEK